MQYVSYIHFKMESKSVESIRYEYPPILVDIKLFLNFLARDIVSVTASKR